MFESKKNESRVEFLKRRRYKTYMTCQKHICCIAFLGIALGCSRGPGGFFGNGRIPVSVEKVLVEEKLATVSASGTLQPSEKIEIQFPFDIKVDRVAINLGDNINAGDPIFFLNEQDFALKLAQLKAKRMEQEAILEKNTYFFRNRERLLEEGKIDKSLHDALEVEVKTTEAQAEKLKSDIALVENQAKQLTVNAPFAGMVTIKNMAPGVISPAHQTLVVLVKPDPMHATFQLSAAHAASVTTGMNIGVNVEDFPDQNFSASIVYISPELDTATKTFEVKAALMNPKRIFKGGMAAQVHFTSPEKVKVLTIPSKAILTDLNKEYVYIVRQNKAWRVRVYPKPNSDNPDMTEIMEGVSEKDMVVVEGQEKLKEGTEVNLWR